MSRIRVGVIGVGYLGKFHAEKYAQMDGVDLVGVVDTDRRRADSIAARLNTRPYYQHQDLIGKVDAVSIAVPTSSHYSIGMEFIEQHVDVLIEKPITTSLAQADQLITTAESQGVLLQVGHLERFNPTMTALQRVIDNPMFIESHRLSVYKDRSTDISVVLDLMIHDIDIILSFVDAKIENIHAAGTPVVCDQVDIASVRLEFGNGCVANITCSRISAKEQRKIRLFQKDTYVSVDFASHDVMIIRRDPQAEDCLIPGMNIEQMKISEGDALADELISFIAAVATRGTPKVTGHAARQALEIALSIMEQIENRIQKYL